MIAGKHFDPILGVDIHIIQPPGPVPVTVARSTPSLAAAFRASGETRIAGLGGCPCAGFIEPDEAIDLRIDAADALQTLVKQSLGCQIALAQQGCECGNVLRHGVPQLSLCNGCPIAAGSRDDRPMPASTASAIR